jgi:hypothetical protein
VVAVGHGVGDADVAERERWGGYLMGGGRWRLKIRANDSSRTERRWGLGVATSAPALSCRAPKPPRRRGGSTRCLRGPGGGPFTRIPMQDANTSVTLLGAGPTRQ